MWLSSPNLTHAQPPVPNGILKVAYRQLTGGKLSDSVHQTELFCWNSVCSLSVLTLNRCMDGAFYPAIERFSTLEGNLSVSRPKSDTVLIVDVKLPDITLEYRFEYAIKSDEQSNKFFGDLTGFSGAAVKNSTILGRIISWDFVPLQGRYPKIKLDCDVSLDGVPERNKMR